MKFCRYCRERLPESAFAKRKASPDGLAYKCRDCDKAYRARRGRSVYSKLRRNSYLKNREREKSKALHYYRQNREACIERHAAYKIKTLEQQKAYRRKTKAAILSRVKAYRAALDNRTPPWLTPEDFIKMSGFYMQSERLKAETGIEFHVDHVIPLRGRNVSGLHVPENLQVIPAKLNLSKGNKHASV